MRIFVSFFTLAPDHRGLALREETKNRAEGLPCGGFFIPGVAHPGRSRPHKKQTSHGGWKKKKRKACHISLNWWQMRKQPLLMHTMLPR
ncbi:hypothetical protein SY86_03940 [Erwinia tracheiphila]|uniref:Uncharacterized protein n=1 Tax=Erwinia tracheiphila TaxID=65700 RepID=A0A0M2K5W6_9GAMM|nr:hypothetical protein SY86_03940 [Erwinia tracheiphila]